MKATKLQKRASKAISRAHIATRKKKKDHAVFQIGENFRVAAIPQRLACTAHQVAQLCGAELIYTEAFTS